MKAAPGLVDTQSVEWLPFLLIMAAIGAAAAYRLIDGRMMHWLLATEGRFGFEVVGNALLVYCSPRSPAQLIPLLGTAKGFRDHIPRMVWAEYGR